MGADMSVWTTHSTLHCAGAQIVCSPHKVVVRAQARASKTGARRAGRGGRRDERRGGHAATRVHGRGGAMEGRASKTRAQVRAEEAPRDERDTTKDAAGEGGEERARVAAGQPLRRCLVLDGRMVGVVKDSVLTGQLTAVTVTAWVRMQRSGDQRIVCSAEAGRDQAGFGLDTYRGRLRFLGSAPSRLNVLSTECPVVLNEWTHVGFTLTADDAENHTLRLFVNGRVEAERGACGPIIASPHPLHVGAPGRGGAQSGVTQAHIAQLTFWHRTLSPPEMRPVYTRVLPEDTSGLRGFFTGELCGPRTPRNMASLLSRSSPENHSSHHACLLVFSRCRIDPLVSKAAEHGPLLDTDRAPRLPWSPHLHAIFPPCVRRPIETLLLLRVCTPCVGALPPELLHLILTHLA
eukprot:TRINITY_DN2959_c0_g1_i3.p1 TRINITY_DN2959_c0_g1~~TRINITY_DN2959_c0_g1_i3.p1  ORF type:complete len:406 (+),score=78.71 TRINITY_DN2959_c0_g1_i3:286-1503(+)